jgi:hypothetical protein
MDNADIRPSLRDNDHRPRPECVRLTPSVLKREREMRALLCDHEHDIRRISTCRAKRTHERHGLTPDRPIVPNGRLRIDHDASEKTGIGEHVDGILHMRPNLALDYPAEDR